MMESLTESSARVGNYVLAALRESLPGNEGVVIWVSEHGISVMPANGQGEERTLPLDAELSALLRVDACA
jgi:hypothetical protein